MIFISRPAAEVHGSSEGVLHLPVPVPKSIQYMREKKMRDLGELVYCSV